MHGAESRDDDGVGGAGWIVVDGDGGIVVVVEQELFDDVVAGVALEAEVIVRVGCA